MITNRPLRVFLCHSSNDKPAVRELYQKLRVEAWLQPWLDEEDIFPGDDWNLEIQKAIRETDAILVCLSKSSVTKEGYVQREIKTALDYSDEKPERTVYIIPVRLEDCKPPERLAKWHYADYFEGQRERALERLLGSLRKRAESLHLGFESQRLSQNDVVSSRNQVDIKHINNEEKRIARSADTPIATFDNFSLPNGMEFMRVPEGNFLMGSDDNNESVHNDEQPKHTVMIPYSYGISRFLVTNELFSVYTRAKKINHPVSDWVMKKDHPVTNVSWHDSTSYCKWLNNIYKDQIPTGFMLRLPTEAEWEKSARGTDGRNYPWGNKFDKKKCNCLDHTEDRRKQIGTTPVGFYSPQGDSIYGCSDTAGNVFEWTSSLYSEYPYDFSEEIKHPSNPQSSVTLRGGSHLNSPYYSRVFSRVFMLSEKYGSDSGFRIACVPSVEGMTNKKSGLLNSKIHSHHVHLEYKINANAKMILDYLNQHYTNKHDTVKFNKVTLGIDGIKLFNPTESDNFQYGFVANGYKKSPFGILESVTVISNMFIVTISQGQRGISILSFDTDVEYANIFSTGLVRELSKVFTVELTS